MPVGHFLNFAFCSLIFNLGRAECNEVRPLDLHALDMPPAFTLSQDQTLLKNQK